MKGGFINPFTAPFIMKAAMEAKNNNRIGT